MINHIDVSTVLRATVCDLYSNLVTRPTGAAVRAEIEQQLADIGGRTLTVIDFSHVSLLDFSCADEIVAKLLLKYCESGARDGRDARDARGDGAGPAEGYFVFRGIHDNHIDAIEAVLEHHGLALIAEGAGGEAELVGIVDDAERRAWGALRQLGGATAEELAAAAGMPPGDAERVLDLLRRRRLVMRVDDAYVPVEAPR
jgi:hypothetical protein